MDIKVGIGEDSHPFTKRDKKLIVGGVEINGFHGFEGNSDGDIVLHAICNAFDVVAQKGSISTYSDKMCEAGINDSSKYVEHIRDIAKERGWRVGSISISIEAKIPRLEPYSFKIKNRIAGLLKINKDDVGLTFTSGEGLTDFGKGKGMRSTVIITFLSAE